MDWAKRNQSAIPAEMSEPKKDAEVERVLILSVDCDFKTF